MEHSAEHYCRGLHLQGAITAQASLDKGVVLPGVADLVHFGAGGEPVRPRTRCPSEPHSTISGQFPVPTA